MVALLLTVLSPTWWSCTSNGCYDNSTALPKAAFYRGGSAASVSGVSLKAIGAPGDSILIDKQATSQFYLPLSATRGSVDWVIDYNVEGIEPDTLTIAYTPQLQFVSRDCGAMYFFRINSVNYTRHVIDDVVITDSLITNVDRVTLKINLQTETTSEE